MIKLTPHREQQLKYEFSEWYESLYYAKPNIESSKDEFHQQYMLWLAFRSGYIQKAKDDTDGIDTWDRI